MSCVNQLLLLFGISLIIFSMAVYPFRRLDYVRGMFIGSMALGLLLMLSVMAIYNFIAASVFMAASLTIICLELFQLLRDDNAD